MLEITLNYLSNKLCVPIKTEDLNLNVFNKITGINESKTLAKDISCEYKCKPDGRKSYSVQWWNNDKSWCECERHHILKKIMFGFLLYEIVKIQNI